MAGQNSKLSLVLLVCVLLLNGCDGTSQVGESRSRRRLSLDRKRVRIDRRVRTGRIEILSAKEKRAELLKRIDRKFEDPDAHFELGQLYKVDGMWSEADHHYRIALDFAPVHRNAQAGRVKILLSSGDATAAGLLAEEYISQTLISDSASLGLGLGFAKQGLDEYALRCYRQALDLAPDSAKANKQMGYYYLGKDDKGQAVEYLTRSFQLNPNQPDVAGELGRLGVEVKR